MSHGDPVLEGLRLSGNRLLYRQYLDFQPRLQEVKANRPLPSETGYYPYHSIEIVPVMVSIADRHDVDLYTFINGKAVVDLACGDGDLAFFFESLGASSTTALDYAPTNFNKLIGFSAVKDALNSSVKLIDGDIHFFDWTTIPAKDTIFCFGFLYHSPHPVLLLQNLARVTTTVFFTTKIFDAPEAYCYFYDISECNNDDTNWWCPTPTALTLMFKRAGFTDLWMERLDSHLGTSHPVDLQRDGRVFGLARHPAPSPAHGRGLG